MCDCCYNQVQCVLGSLHLQVRSSCSVVTLHSLPLTHCYLFDSLKYGQKGRLSTWSAIMLLSSLLILTDFLLWDSFQKTQRWWILRFQCLNVVNVGWDRWLMMLLICIFSTQRGWPVDCRHYGTLNIYCTFCGTVSFCVGRWLRIQFLYADLWRR